MSFVLTPWLAMCTLSIFWDAIFSSSNCVIGTMKSGTRYSRLPGPFSTVYPMGIPCGCVVSEVEHFGWLWDLCMIEE